jgi:hypothetical protein
MSEVHKPYVSWPTKAPNTAALARIRQIRYFINVNTSQRKGFVDVWSINIFSKDDKGDHWRWLPAVYTDHLKRIIYRFNVYFSVLDCVEWGKRPQELNELKIHISYLDKVLDEIWDEVRIAGNADELTPTWRSAIFDEWLQMEFLVRRHDPDSLKAYKKAGKTLQDDPMELGKYLLNIFNRVFL